MPTDWIAALEAGATLVTASDRLSRHLLRHFADHQLASGRQVWERPDILPESAFWRRLANGIREEGLLETDIAGTLAVTAWWEGAIADTFRDRPLLQASGAARSALDAWSLMHDWCLDPGELANDFLEEARLLHRWGNAFERWCQEQQLLTENRFPEQVLACLETSKDARRLPAKVLFAGFLEFTPRQAERLERLRRLDCTVEIFASPTSGNARKISCTDARAEHRAIASWAASHLRRDSERRIAIVVPDLSARRRELRRQLLDALAPDWLPAFRGDEVPFNFSLGEPLLEEPLVRCALGWLLAVESNRLEFVDAARLARSPYLGVGKEWPERLQLEQFLRNNGYAEFSLRDFAFAAQRSGCPAFAEGLLSAREQFEEARRAGRQLPSAWARHASRLLQAGNWCQPSVRSLDSHEYQAREAFNGLLGRLAELDTVIGATTLGKVLGWLRRLATETLFQPRAVDAPVQVLGLFEATGMSFDAVWIAGLDDGSLPAAPHPNPFIPLAIQREHGLPQSSARHEQEFAARLFRGLAGSASEVVCSHAEREGDAELRASPLLESLPTETLPKTLSTVAERWLGQASAISVVDDRGPAFSEADARGGTRLLEDQSACGFRAFANHRLNAGDWPTPDAGPDALMRGSLVHDVMESLWRRWRTRAELQRRHDEGVVDGDIAEVVESVISSSERRERFRWRKSLADLERARLRAGISRWVEQVELRRPDFSIIELEGLPPDATPPPDADYTLGLTPVQAGPVRVRGKLDRVDRLQDGGELIIDYKSGAAPSLSRFFGDRPQAPQLPAYVVAREQAGHPVPVGIAVASLRSGNETLRGIAMDNDESDRIDGIMPVSRNRGIQDWDDAVVQWKSVIRRLGEEFAAGHAGVDPLPGACDYCHLATLCRIHEIRVDSGADDVEIDHD